MDCQIAQFQPLDFVQYFTGFYLTMWRRRGILYLQGAESL